MILLLLALACIPDDWDGTPYHPPGTSATDTGGGAGDAALVGDWLSTGSDLSPLFASSTFDYTSVTASFGADGHYTATTKDRGGQTNTVQGTYTVDLSTDPAGISLDQTSPYAALASGIYEVDGDTLTYEVVQTSPDYGYSPPTPSQGFGSTSGPGLSEGDNVQIYRRQP